MSLIFRAEAVVVYGDTDFITLVFRELFSLLSFQENDLTPVRQRFVADETEFRGVSK